MSDRAFDRASDFGRELLDFAVDGTDAGEHPLRHVSDLPPRQASSRPWPPWAEPDVVRAFVDRGVTEPWSHQVAAADLAHSGRHVVLSTGTASGKSLAYQLPILSALAADPRARVLYLSPTKALGHDQLRAAQSLTDAVERLRRRRSRVLRRRQLVGCPPLRAGTLAVDLLQSRHDPPLDVAQPRPVGRVPAPPAVRRRRRMSLLPWHIRVQCRDGAASPGPAVRTLLGERRRGTDRLLRQRDDVVPGGHRVRTARAHRGRGDRRRLAAGRSHGGPVGARSACGHHRRERRSGAALRRFRGCPGDGRPDRRGRPHADVRPVPTRCRADGPRRAGPPRGRRARSRRPRRVLPRRVSRRGPAGTRTGTLRRRAARPRHHERAGVGRRHRRPRRGGAGRLPRHRYLVLAAGGPGGTTRTERADRAHRARRSAGHLPGPPPGRTAGPARSSASSSIRPTRTSLARSCSARQPNYRSPRPRCGPGTPRRWRTPSSTTDCLRRRPAGYFPTPRRRSPSAPWTSAGRRAVRSRSSRPGPVACWAAPARARPRRRCTPARYTCTRARVTSSTHSTSRTASPSSAPTTPATRRRPGSSPTSRSPATANDAPSATSRSGWCRCR